MNYVYTNAPEFENTKYLLRKVESNDIADLLKVYSDKAAAVLFNSDNCNGDTFYYTTKEMMAAAIDFWLNSYD